MGTLERHRPLVRLPILRLGPGAAGPDHLRHDLTIAALTLKPTVYHRVTEGTEESELNRKTEPRPVLYAAASVTQRVGLQLPVQGCAGSLQGRS